MTILLVCRNRRETTLAALRRIAAQDTALPYRVVLFDDASSDGTPHAVLAEFPDTTVVPGDGHAFWNGGLHRAWQRALDESGDAFLWLNDDVELDPDAFRRLAKGWSAQHEQRGDEAFILVGATRDATGRTSYGGFRRRASPVAFKLDKIDPTGAPLEIDTFNGNIVLVPRAVVARIGINDPLYHHNLGDIDYGLRAVGANVSVMLLPGTLGLCEYNAGKAARSFGSPALTLREQWRMVNSHHGLPVASWWHFTRRHSGAWWPLHFALPYRHLFLPRLAAIAGRRER